MHLFPLPDCGHNVSSHSTLLLPFPPHHNKTDCVPSDREPESTVPPEVAFIKIVCHGNLTGVLTRRSYFGAALRPTLAHDVVRRGAFRFLGGKGHLLVLPGAVQETSLPQGFCHDFASREIPVSGERGKSGCRSTPIPRVIPAVGSVRLYLE